MAEETHNLTSLLNWAVQNQTPGVPADVDVEKLRDPELLAALFPSEVNKVRPLLETAARSDVSPSVRVDALQGE